MSRMSIPGYDIDDLPEEKVVADDGEGDEPSEDVKERGS